LGTASGVSVELKSFGDIDITAPLMAQTTSDDIVLQNNAEKVLIRAKEDTISIGSDIDTQKINIGNSLRSFTNGMTVVNGKNTYIEGATSVHIK